MVQVSGSSKFSGLVIPNFFLRKAVSWACVKLKPRRLALLRTALNPPDLRTAWSRLSFWSRLTKAAGPFRAAVEVLGFGFLAALALLVDLVVLVRFVAAFFTDFLAVFRAIFNTSF